MSADKLIYMANQIAGFMRTRGDEVSAQAGIAAHINDYWEPRMRRELLAQIAAAAPQLSPLVTAAAPLIRPPPEADKAAAAKA